MHDSQDGFIQKLVGKVTQSRLTRHHHSSLLGVCKSCKALDGAQVGDGVHTPTPLPSRTASECFPPETLLSCSPFRHLDDALSV